MTPYEQKLKADHEARLSFMDEIREIMNKYEVKVEFSWHNEFEPYFRGQGFIVELPELR